MTTLADFATSLQSWILLSNGINGSNGELTVYHNVLAVPKVARVVENTCIDVRRVLPGFPLLARAALVLTRACHGSDTDGVVTHRQRRGWASGNQSRDWCSQRYSWMTSRLCSRTSRRRDKHCGEECRDDRESWLCASCRRSTRP
jgi:hypothetical protein